MAGDAKALQVGGIEAGSAVAYRLNMVDLVGAGAAFGTKGIRGKLPAAKLLPGAIIAPLRGRKLPGRLLAPGPGVLVHAAFLHHAYALPAISMQ